MVTTKFKAWASPSSFLAGIPLQIFGVTSQQERQALQFKKLELFFDGYTVRVSSTVSSPGGFGANNLIDQNPKTPWSSVGHASEDENEWFAFWFPRQSVNMLELTPRRSSNKAYGFPKTIDISYSAGPNDWQHIRTVDLSNPEDGKPEDASSNVLVSLDKTITTDGLLVRATKLRTDSSSNYYFQMAGARVGYRSVTFNEDEAKNAAVLLPTSLFFLHDEPDTFLPADEYALVYDRFVAAVKRGSSSARVSPGGFTFDNNIYGSVLSDYAQNFFSAVGAPVDEWRFHYFSGDSDCYEKVFSPLAQWSTD